MSQPIRPSQVQMDISSMGGNEGMRRTAASPGPNALLGAANPAINNQMVQQAQLAQQNLQQRMQDSMSQNMAGQERNMDEMQRGMNEQEFAAQNLLNETKSNILEANSSGNAMMALSDRGLAEKVSRDIASQRAISERLNPDLGDYAGQLSA